MKKNKAAYWALLLPTAALCLAACIVTGIWAFAAGFGVFALWWTLYFCGQRCIIDGGALAVSGGVFFGKTRKISLDEIIFTTDVVLRLPKGRSVPLFSVVRTGGGAVVIFSHFSTNG